MKGNNKNCTRVFNKIAGVALLLVGVLFIVGSAMEWFNATNGSIPATGFLLIMFGFVFLFPELLRARKDETGMSSIRFLAFMIVSCFVFMTIMFSWGKPDFGALNLNSTWAYIIAIALGAKTVQTFAENRNVTKEQKEFTFFNKKYTTLADKSKTKAVPADDMSGNYKN